MTKILVLNGPNLGKLLGRREPEIYGSTTWAELMALMEVRAKELEVELRFEQSNHEGKLIDILEEEHQSADGCIINPGGLSHTSVSLLDALRAFEHPVIEVHLSDVAAREPYRQVLITSEAAQKIIAGQGVNGYIQALEVMEEILRREDR